MCAIIVGDELLVPSIRSGDPRFVDDLLRKQFSSIVSNAYIIVDLMFEIGDYQSSDQTSQYQNVE